MKGDLGNKEYQIRYALKILLPEEQDQIVHSLCFFTARAE
jgi:hypothetical protein